MDRILVDTNIILDLLGKREPYWPEAQALFDLAEKKKVELFVSALSIPNIHYILLRQLKSGKVLKILRRFKLLVKVLALDDKIISLALDSDFRDFEDAIQYFSALENNIRVIVTRNVRDFRTSQIPVLTARDYLAMRDH